LRHQWLASVLLASVVSTAAAQRSSLPERALVHVWLRGDPDRHDGWIQSTHGDSILILPQRSHGAWHTLLETDTLLGSGTDSLHVDIGGHWYHLYLAAPADGAGSLSISTQSSPLETRGITLQMSSAVLGWVDQRAIVRGKRRGDSLDVVLLDSAGREGERRMVAPSSLDRLAVRLAPRRSRMDRVRGGFMVGERIAGVLYLSAVTVSCMADACGPLLPAIPYVFAPFGVIGAGAGAMSSPRPEVWIDVRLR
jgi:hypothetical protein